MFLGIEVGAGGGCGMSYTILESASRERNARIQWPPSTRNPAVHGPRRRDRSANRAVRPHVHDLRARAVNRPKFQLSYSSRLYCELRLFIWRSALSRSLISYS
ncbi:hypothetical protein FIBSPDRAFT_321228 [Athelia psychrophila]|uniref:Uncharacterized protein n=1 Tax=Athelia psychrophila TaxID=1759441 RepID=A0A166QIR9_9AGAM|nr:hypothetical protein FIBSPDRAFT_321228 [Fibularhizoctonia sp. CBS 109695]